MLYSSHISWSSPTTPTPLEIYPALAFDRLFKDEVQRGDASVLDAVLADAADVVRSVVRSADIACRVGGDEFAVILPESGMQEAEQLHARLQQALEQRPIGQVGRIRLSAGVAELTRGDDSRAFFERADDALYGAKEAGKGRAVAADHSA
jgi:diguanylate cyclase (GGDEF)-like protein